MKRYWSYKKRQLTRAIERMAQAAWFYVVDAPFERRVHFTIAGALAIVIFILYLVIRSHFTTLWHEHLLQ